MEHPRKPIIRPPLPIVVRTIVTGRTVYEYV